MTSYSARLAATLLGTFICLAGHTAAHAAGCGDAPPAGQDSSGSSGSQPIVMETHGSHVVVAAGVTGYGKPAYATFGQALERRREYRYRLAVRADSDGAGQSFAGESITNPASCHGVVLDSGNKVHVETDFEGSGEMPLTLTRGYNKAAGSGIFGNYWSSSFDYHVNETGQMCPEPEETFVQPEWCYSGRLSLLRPGGVRITLLPVDGQAGVFSRDLYRAQELRNAQGELTGWEVHTDDDRVETYGVDGNPITILNEHGIGWTYTWIPNYYPSGVKVIDRIDHTSGRYVKFNYVSKNVGWTTLKQLASIQDPNFGIHNYTYVDESGGWRLGGVTLPNGDARTYHYEIRGQEPAGTLQHALTGVSVNGVRYSTYDYYPDTGQPGGYEPPNPNNPNGTPAEWQDGRVKETRLAGDVERTTFSYVKDAGGGIQTTTATNALGAVWTYQYEKIGKRKQLRWVTATAPAGPNSCPNTPKEIQYDTNGNPTLLVDWQNNQTKRVYNANRQLVREVTGAGVEARSTIMVWAADHNAIEREEYYDGDVGPGPGTGSATMVAKTEYTYYPATDPQKYRLKTITRTDIPTGQSRLTSYTYALHANGIVSRVDADGRLPGTQDVDNSFYDEQGDLLSVRNALGHEATSSGHNGFGLPAQTTDVNGLTTTFQYDALGRMTYRSRTVSGQAATETFAFNGHGAMTSHTYPGQTHLWQYSGNGRLWGERLTSNTDDFKAYEYDLLGNKTKSAILQNVYVTDQACLEAGGTFQQCRVIAPDPAVKYQRSWTYYTDGRVKTESGNNGQNIQYAYDDVNKTRTVTDSLLRSTTSYLDSLGQVYMTRSPAPAPAPYYQTEFGYDALGNLIWAKDPKDGNTTYVHDGFGERKQQHSPDTGDTTFNYDIATNRRTMTRQDQTQTISQYDALNRVTSVTAGSLLETYTYDSCPNGKGLVCSVANADTSTSYAYTAEGFLDTQTVTIAGASYAVDHDYDVLGRLTDIKYSQDGVASALSVVHYTYNAEDEVISVTATINGAPVTVANAFAYLPFGPRTSMKYGNTAIRTQTYDVDYRLKTIVSTGIQSLTYTLNANDEITNIVNGQQSAATQAYSYDEASRLKGDTKTGGKGNESWTFDANGNRETHAWGGATDDYVPEPYSNRIPAIVGGTASRTRAMDHDDLGNITAAQVGTQTPYIYGFDPFNRLASVTKDAQTTTYHYDASNQRVRKAGATPEIRYLWAGGQLLAETGAGSATLSTFYIRVGGEVIGLVKGGVLYYVHNDHLGRPEVVTDIAKTHKWKARNYAYDREVATTSAQVPSLNLGFPGQYYDAESGLWYNLNRYYDAATGRYITSDPIGLLGGLNTYSYVNSSPTDSVDPEGLLFMTHAGPFQRGTTLNDAMQMGQPGSVAGAAAGVPAATALGAIHGGPAVRVGAAVVKAAGIKGITQAAKGINRWRQIFEMLKALLKGADDALPAPTVPTPPTPSPPAVTAPLTPKVGGSCPKP